MFRLWNRKMRLEKKVKGEPPAPIEVPDVKGASVFDRKAKKARYETEANLDIDRKGDQDGCAWELQDAAREADGAGTSTRGGWDLRADRLAHMPRGEARTARGWRYCTPKREMPEASISMVEIARGRRRAGRSMQRAASTSRLTRQLKGPL